MARCVLLLRVAAQRKINAYGQQYADNQMMMILLLFSQKQNLASALYLFGLGTRLSG